MHREANSFLLQMKAIFPQYFSHCNVLDIGSADINGSNRFLFNYREYLGVDIGDGENVDLVVKGAADMAYKLRYLKFHAVISTEVLEHAEDWVLLVRGALQLLDERGMLILTCAGPERSEHGTRRSEPAMSPYTQDYYGNVSAQQLAEVLHGAVPRHEWGLVMEGRNGQDTYAIVFPKTPTPRFVGAKRRYVLYEFQLFGLQRIQRWKRFFRRWFSFSSPLFQAPPLLNGRRKPSPTSPVDPNL